MAYDFKKYQEEESRKAYLRFAEYRETADSMRFREEEMVRLTTYIELCSEYSNDRANTERRYQQMLDGRMQMHEREEMKRSICMKI